VVVLPPWCLCRRGACAAVVGAAVVGAAVVPVPPWWGPGLQGKEKPPTEFGGGLGVPVRLGNPVKSGAMLET
jgi:hypothetical protein